MTTKTKLNPSLASAFEQEMQKLEEFSRPGSVLSMNLRQFVGEVEIQDLELREYFETSRKSAENQDIQLDIFLRLIGYNKTNFSATSQISEKYAKLVSNENISLNTRYELLYLEGQIEACDIESLIEMSNLGVPVMMVDYLSRSRGVSISDLANNFRANSKMMTKKNLANKELVELAVFCPPRISVVTQTLAKLPCVKRDLASRMRRVIDSWLKREITDGQVRVICKEFDRKDHSSITKMLNQSKAHNKIRM